MSLDLWIILGEVLILIILSAFFSGSETALTAASRARMHQLEKSGEKRAGLVARLIAMRERLIGAILLGNNLVNILASSLATSFFIATFGEGGVVYATLVMTVVVVVFAEVLPKTYAIAHPDRFALVVAPTIRVIVALFGPITLAIEVLVRRILRLFGTDIAEGQPILSGHEELRGAVDLLHKEGEVVKDDRDRIGGLLNLADMEVSDIMIHRTKMQALNLDDPAQDIVDQVLQSSFTRLPIWQDEPDNIVGILHSKDLLRALHKVGGDVTKLDIASVALPAWFVPDTTSLQDQLNAFLKRKKHFAVVVDEYGEVMGLVTLEDILEEIVGEIADEHDIDMQGVRTQPDGAIIVEGSVPVRDLNRAYDWDLPDEEATTIAGLVIHEARTIPETGQVFTFHDFRFTVLRRQRNRITQLRIMPVKGKRAY